MSMIAQGAEPVNIASVFGRVDLASYVFIAASASASTVRGFYTRINDWGRLERVGSLFTGTIDNVTAKGFADLAAIPAGASGVVFDSTQNLKYLLLADGESLAAGKTAITAGAASAPTLTLGSGIALGLVP
jgi:hypothetical protein